VTKDTPSVGERLRQAIGDAQVVERAPLGPFTTFRVGGPADWLATITSEPALSAVLAVCHEAAVPVTILGGGSNVVVADEGIRGVVLRLQMTAITQPSRERVRAHAGVTMNGLVRWTIGRGLAALEAWAGTPGTVGGAIYGNAHYAGRNIGDLVVEVGLVSPDGRSSTVPRASMEFAYDTSRLKRTREVLAWADFAVVPGSPEALRETARRSLAHRKGTQPLAFPSAGCMFQNPDPARDTIPAGIPPSAGALIDRAGLKGHRIGGAMISPVHANFFVSDGTATASDIHALAEHARTTVRNAFGVDLRDEIIFLGRF
jgi:UDP-N-acetylmuramate dehydrogenase